MYPEGYGYVPDDSSNQVRGMPPSDEDIPLSHVHESEMSALNEVFQAVDSLESRLSDYMDGRETTESNDPSPMSKPSYPSTWDEYFHSRLETIHRLGRRVDNIRRQFRG